ncbi:hypothetical protein DFS34DRAFT_648167 [Phlyctochytrium arcticum]|nr:hypothetical protein DFS34DRAFT_648167 [Phlyctochytrium arcticum]
MVDEGGRPAAVFPDPDGLWANSDGEKVPTGQFEASLPFGTVVAVQATFLSYHMFTSTMTRSPGSSRAGPSTPPPNRKRTEQESHMAHTMTLTTIKIVSAPMPDVVHGNDALTAQAEDWLNSL